jgi:hypothetical protein
VAGSGAAAPTGRSKDDRVFLMAELRPEEARTAGHRGFFLFDGV